MKNAIILHGRPAKNEYYDASQPSPSNEHWVPWLQNQLIIHDIKTDTPEVPFAFEPKWDLWVKEVERFDITPETMLVGHSTGGGFWVRYLSEHPEIQVDKVLLVAPWVNAKHEEPLTFFDFEFDPTIVERTNKFTIFASDNDFQVVRDSIAYLNEKLPNITVRNFHNYGHFCYEDIKTDAFPELLEVLL